ncbi:MAG: hypothetical protein USCAAHI_02572 [Beijerinckiaceae bacterium]|nr:MAG: hypothetical protein USCAAHI_02572 [Beijerinckiaceae bacterium]
MMERVLLVGGAMVAVGITLVAVWVLITSYGTTFEMVEDHVTGWLEGR